LPVGGIKEKALAALNKGIKNVIIPAKNEKDLIEIPQDLREQINFIRVNHLDEVRTLVIIEGGGEGDGQKRKTT